jgi:glutaminyl-tRNA synthetase
MSKTLLQLVQKNMVNGTIKNAYYFWIEEEGIPKFNSQVCESIGVAKSENIIDFSLLEFCLRDDLK